MAFVTTANVPSLPIIKFFNEKPVESFTTFLPNCSILPVGKTTSNPTTQSLVVPY